MHKKPRLARGFLCAQFPLRVREPDPFQVRQTRTL
jgi:hypothetical protein